MFREAVEMPAFSNNDHFAQRRMPVDTSVVTDLEWSDLIRRIVIDAVQWVNNVQYLSTQKYPRRS